LSHQIFGEARVTTVLPNETITNFWVRE